MIILKILFIAIAVVAVLCLFAFSLCWAAHEAEIMKDEEDEKEKDLRGD